MFLFSPVQNLLGISEIDIWFVYRTLLLSWTQRIWHQYRPRGGDREVLSATS
jgi:hypothetical protein